MKFMMVILLAIGWIASMSFASPDNKVNATTLNKVLKDVSSALRPLQELHDELVGKFDEVERVVDLPVEDRN